MPNYIFPPRPGGRIPPTDLRRLEATGRYLAQPKYQGSRLLTQITGGGDVNLWDRHRGRHVTFTLSRTLREEILALPGRRAGVEYWLDGEVFIKTKGQHFRNKVVFFDILYAGTHLVYTPSQEERLDLLEDLCGRPTVFDRIGLVASSQILLSPRFYEHFFDRFQELHCEEVEGLVLREKTSVISSYGNKEYDVPWQVKCRHPSSYANF